MRKKRSLSVLALLLVVLLAVVPVIVSAAYFATTTSEKLENNARNTVDFYISQFTERSESILRSLRGSIYILTTDPQISAAMRTPGMRSQSGWAAAEENATRIFANIGFDQDSITGIFLVQDEENYISVLRQGIYSGATRRALDIYAEHSVQNNARSLVASGKHPGYVYLITDYLDINFMAPLGKIIIEIAADRFVNSDYLTNVYPGAAVYLSDLSGTILFGDTSLPLAGSVTSHIPTSGNFITTDAGDYYYRSSRLGIYNLRVNVFVPNEEIFAAVNDTLRVYTLFTILLLLATLVAGMGIYAWVTRPLRQMVSGIEAVSSGDLNTRMPPTPYRETEQVRQSFNSMAQHLQELFDEAYTKGLHLRQAEFIMLESQINPHFIFNVLEVINMRAMAAGQQDICRMVENLAQLIRSNILQKNRQKITFGQELQYVRYYLELQKERFGNALSYDIDLEDDNILEYYLPKLTIQPVVENSVVHGLENKRGGGQVRVSIWEEDTGIYVRVSDNGIGFDTTLLRLQRPLREAEEDHNHVALYNINRRIQILYGEEYGLSAHSTPGEGTEITLCLPVDTQQDGQGVETWN